ncbi:nuclear transport factor 2 family protein [Herbiconiux sp. L3-i23]|uniref:nuclear transport factor 2 family protein n=1 Tax=Herbiconiux sp. L3-i23 TaxID=2905871 RepID=UPI00205E35A9|nr:nuclear transport factor 2 family protein [Herbiconiux sp. L3-i23]BDI22612.1 hypothetical protein L3i23_13880 [Herbiconiux sp. L3-i23]
MSDTFDVAGLRAAETRLQQAMLAGDAEALGDLMSEHAHYVGPGGADLDREADLETYRSGALHLDLVEPVKILASLHEGLIGETRSTLHLRGVSHGIAFDTVAVYNRTWLFDAGRWQVIAATGETAV